MADVGIRIKATDEASGVFGKVAAEAGKLQSSVASAGSAFAAMGTAAVAGLSVVSFATKVKEAIDLADSFNKLSQKTGVAVESLSKLNYAAGLADVSTEALSTGLKKLNVNISAAAGGSAQQAEVFKALGISVKDAAGNVLSADNVMAQLADSFAESADGANKAAIAVALFGKSGTDLIPLLNAGSKGLADMGDEAKKLGIVMGADFARNAEEFNDNLHKISLAGQGLFVTLGGDLVKGLGATVKAMAEASLEGGKLAAVIAGIQALFTGDDQYKSDKALVQQTELMLSLEKSLAVARATGNAAYIKSREDALAAVNAEIKTTMAYRKVLQGVAEDKAKAEAPKPTQDSAAVKAAAAAIAKRTNVPGIDKEKGNAFAGEQEAAKEWAKALEAAGKASDELVAKNLDLSKSESALKVYMESAAAAINEKTNPAMNAMIKAAYEANIALEAMGKLADVIEAQQKRTSTAEDETTKERERVAAIGLTTEAVADLNATRLEEMATAKERTLVAADEIDLSGEYSAAIRGEVKALRERAALLRTGAAKENAVEAAKAASEEWKRGWEQTDQLAREAFTSWAEDGTSMAEAIGKSLKKALLSAIYEATLKPLAFQIYTSFAGGGGIGNTALQAAGGASNSLGLFGSAGGLFGSGFKAGLGAVFGESGTMGGLSAGWTALGAGNVAGGLGTLAGAALPWIGGAMALKGLTDYQITPTGNALTATLSSSGIPSGQVGTRADFTQSSSGFLSGGTTQNSTWGVADSATTGYISNNVVAGTAAVKSWAAAIGLSASAVDGYTKSIEVSLTGLNQEQQKAAIDKAIGSFVDDMVKSAFGGTLEAFAKEGETSSQTLQRLAVYLTSVNSVFDTLGYSLLDVSTAGASAAEGLLAAFGGLQNFQAQTAAMYSNFYTKDEQKSATVKGIYNELTALGITTSESDLSGADRATWRTVLDAFAKDTGTEEGAKKYAALVSAANKLNPYLDGPDSAQKSAAAAPASVSSATTSSVVNDSALSAWQDATDAIVSAMSDLRSTLLGDGVDSFSKLQAQFAIEAAQAKAGDLSAAQDLPALARALVDAGKSFNTTSVAQALLTARVIDTLGSVAGVTGAGSSLSIPHFAAGGYHDGGWALVGEQGPELVNMPRARVFNANDTRAMLGGGSDPALLEEVRALRAELAAIRANTGSTASNTGKTAKVLDASANGGQPLGTKAIA